MEFNQLKLKNAPVCKLTIEQSKELLEKAQESNKINKESHIVAKLQKNIKKYGKFHRNYQDYTRFKKRLQQEIEESKDQTQGFSRDQNELRFTYEFVKNLINDTEQIDIDILGENNYNKDKD